MPRFVRNTWIDIGISGRATPLAGGPATKDGGMGGDIYIRNKGSVSRLGSLRQWVDGDSVVFTFIIDRELRRDPDVEYTVWDDGIRVKTTKDPKRKTMFT